MDEFLQLMVPDDSACYIGSMNSLVFMDLESTGLPYEIGRKNVQITEIAMVAIDRKSFEVDSCRIVNKLSICVRPRSNISYTAMNMTGLCEDMLETQSQFDKTIPPILKAFFKRLRPPICLLAHNGKNFDFPLLQAELKRVRCKLDREILCADTMEAFRSIYLSHPSSFLIQNYNINEIGTSNLKSEKPVMINQEIQTDINNVKSTSITDDEIERMLSTDLDIFRNMDLFDYGESSQKENENTPLRTSNNLDNNFINTVPHNHKPKFVSIEKNNQMPAKRKLHFADECSIKIKKEMTELETSNGHCSTSNGHCSTSNGHCSTSNGYCSTSNGHYSTTNGHSSTNVQNLVKNGTMRYSLNYLYEHFFKRQPENHHQAEGDCYTLAEVCMKVSNHFLKWIDDHSVAFCDTIPMW